MKQGSREWIEYCLKTYGPLNFGCGPSAQEKNIAGAQDKFANTMTQNYSTLFGEQQGTINALNAIAQPMASMGLAGEGFSPTALAAMNTGILDRTAANYAAASRATNAAIAGRGAGGAGTPGIISGPEQQILGSVASAAAGQQSAEQQQLAIANQQQALANIKTAAGIESGIAGLESPVSTGQTATSGLGQAFSEADKIQQEKNQATADIVGGIAGLGMDAATFGAGFMGGGGLKGGLTALAGGGFGGGGSAGTYTDNSGLTNPELAYI